MAHTLTPATPIAASEPGALSGHAVLCSCGLRITSSLSARQVEADGERHLAWHARTGR